MCGLAGLLLGKRRRSEAELDFLKDLFTGLLVESEARGRHASGMAVLDRARNYYLMKRPIAASRLVGLAAFDEVLSTVEGRFGQYAGRTTLLLGHTRYRTRGDAANNANNHPLRSGDWIGAVNGTVLNADALFRHYRLHRHAEVDSELLLRVADKSSNRGTLDLIRFIKALRPIRGQLSAVFASLRDPEATYVIHGNRPLVLRAHRQYRVIAYASEARFLDAVLGDMRGWRDVELSSMTLARFTYSDLFNPEYHTIDFIAQERPRLRDLPKTAARQE